jgi:hypothetical protein
VWWFRSPSYFGWTAVGLRNRNRINETKVCQCPWQFEFSHSADTKRDERIGTLVPIAEERTATLSRWRSVALHFRQLATPAY